MANVTYHLRVDDVDERHVRFTVFADGANCGCLCMTGREFLLFGAALLIGGRRHRSVDVGVDPLPVKLKEKGDG